MSSDTTQPTDETQNRPHHTDLTAFQIDMLAVCGRLEAALDEVHGLAIKQGLEEIYYKEINHGRLYPNLDELAEIGLIEKQIGLIDKRTNSYRVTGTGYRLLDVRRTHLAMAVDGWGV